MKETKWLLNPEQDRESSQRASVLYGVNDEDDSAQDPFKDDADESEEDDEDTPEDEADEEKDSDRDNGDFQ